MGAKIWVYLAGYCCPAIPLPVCPALFAVPFFQNGRLTTSAGIRIRVENTGTRPLELYLRGRTIAFDVFVTHPNGDVVWQRLKDQVIPAIIQLKVLQPGEVFELEEEWLQRGNGGEPLGPGSYVVRGSVLTDGPAGLETARASLRIVPN